MNRRRFLSFLGQATVGATVAYSFPSIIVPKNIQPVVDSYLMTPYGLGWLINDQSRVLQGINVVTFRPDAMPAQFFNYAQTFLNVMFEKTSAIRAVVER